MDKNKGVLSVGNNKIHEALYDAMIENGFRGVNDNSREKIIQAMNEGRGLLICTSGTLQIMLYPEKWDIISIAEAVKIKYSRSIEVLLNDSYKAEVSRDYIKVGSETFTFQAFDKLAEAVKKVRGE